MIYEFIVTRTTESVTCANNFKGLDRAVKHYDAGDVQDIAFKQVIDAAVHLFISYFQKGEKFHIVTVSLNLLFIKNELRSFF